MTSQPLSPAQIAEIRGLVEAGLSQRAIARDYGYNARTVRKYAGKPATPAPSPNAWTEERTARAQAMVDDGVPYAEIARTLGASEKTLRKKFGPSPYRLGELTTFYNSVRRLEGRGSFHTYGSLRSA